MKKPTKKHPVPECYDYDEIIRYVESKYGFETRGYKRELDGEYRDFWHWLLDHVQVHNGCMIHLPSYWRDEGEPWWAREIMDLIVGEFFPGNLVEGGTFEDMRVWVEW